MEDLKNLEFLAVNSKEIIEKQVDSYRQQHTYAGTIIGAIALFIPFFLSGFDGTSHAVQFISIVPIAFFILSILLMLSIFRTKPLDQAFNVSKYKDLLDKTYKEILLFEIDANAHSYTINKVVTEKGNRKYSKGVSLAIIALLSSIVLILANKFVTINKAPTKVQVVNIKKLNGSNSTSDSDNRTQLVYPNITPEKR
jgi:Na+/melibiose symporter-like transporter